MDLSFGHDLATDKRDAIRLIRTTYELGVNFFDSAEAYIWFRRFSPNQ